MDPSSPPPSNAAPASVGRDGVEAARARLTQLGLRARDTAASNPAIAEAVRPVAQQAQQALASGDAASGSCMEAKLWE